MKKTKFELDIEREIASEPLTRPSVEDVITSGGFSEDERIRHKNQYYNIKPRGAPEIKTRLTPLFGATLMLVPPDGYLRCLKCRIAKPKETGFHSEDIVDELSGWCKDCIKSHTREALTISFKMRE
jgi:hypothetical protein